MIALRLLGAGDRVLLAACVAGIAGFGVVLAGYLAARREGARVPPRNALLMWAGAAGLALHGASPFVAGTRAVPAALFFFLGYGLRPAASVPSMLGVAGWLGTISFGTAGKARELASIAVVAAVSGAAGIFLRRCRVKQEPEDALARETTAGSRSLVLPWEEPRKGGQPPGEGATEEAVLLRRELDLKDGIRRALEGLLPMIGAAHVAYVWPSPAPGSAGHEGLLVSRGAGPAGRFPVPDTYVPVREAALFRRPFLEEGNAAQMYAPPGLGAGFRATGIVAVPVLCGEKVEGVLLGIREEDGGWPDSTTSLAELVAYFLGRDIEKVRLLHQGERYLIREDWYHRMVRKMAQAGEEEPEGTEGGLPLRRQRVYAESIGQLRRQVGATRALLIGTSDGGKTGYVTWEESDSRSGGSDRPEPIAESYVGWVIRTGSRRIFTDAQGASRGQGVLPTAWRNEGERSFLLLPVAGAGGFRGAVVCCHTEEGRFHRQHAETARDVTEVMQLGLSHVAHLEELARRASTDGLTGLPNRKAFLERLETELARLDGRHPLAVIMMDIDHFKRINDSYGHPFGDEVLRRVASVLGKAIRRGDAAGRYGGEEFVLFLSLTDPVKAMEGAERFRRMVRQTKFQHGGREVAVTASFGVSCAPGHGTAAGELLKRADEALYLSKQRGRDRVTLFPG
ncbi:MAG: GGDEF domain-containing protein [Thermodesulfobacteriota bacterium]